MAEKISLILDGMVTSLAAQFDLESDQGCYLAEHELYLLNNRGVLLHQISQWLMVLVLPITSFIFTFAGIRAFKTHGPSFDSIVLFLCASYNVLYLVRGVALCENSIQLATILFMTGMILYLYVNFEKVLDNLEKEMIATRNG